MDKRTKGEKFFILVMITVAMFAVVCLTSCKGTCLGYTLACKSGNAGCGSSFGYLTDGCSSDSCLSTCACLDTDRPVNDKCDTFIMACDYEEDGFFSSSKCYDGFYCGSCFGCGIFYGEEDYETTVGCFDGCLVCDDIGLWDSVLNNFYYSLDVK